MKKRILVVEDEQPILQFLQRGLTHKGFETIAAVNGEEALKAVRDDVPDLVVLDVMLPDFDGVEVCQYLRSMGNETLPILMLTARDELTDKIAGLNSGADDYITKPFDFEELVARIRAALRRVESLQPLSQTIEVGDMIIDVAAHQVIRAGKPVELTHREYDLLEFLAQNVGCVLTKERIFERVWGYDNEAGLEVIKVYINYLRTKLNSNDQPDLIHAIRGVGYMLKP
ncbi:MAG: response regulator transcription factor [Ktedonobacteraceae bacterium]|nr:response regulator transcription factor [Chloroflexota bacterium]